MNTKKTWEELSPLMGVITDAELAALRPLRAHLETKTPKDFRR